MSSKSSTKHQRFHETDAIVTRRSCPQKAAAHPLFQHLTFGTRAQVTFEMLRLFYADTVASDAPAINFNRKQACLK